jgi:hypothetical protein
MFLVVQEEGEPNKLLLKRKAGASSRTPNGVIYRVNDARGIGKVKENFAAKTLTVRASGYRQPIAKVHLLAGHN